MLVDELFIEPDRMIELVPFDGLYASSPGNKKVVKLLDIDCDRTVFESLVWFVSGIFFGLCLICTNPCVKLLGFEFMKNKTTVSI